jgi:hypothetical protein
MCWSKYSLMPVTSVVVGDQFRVLELGLWFHVSSMSTMAYGYRNWGGLNQQAALIVHRVSLKPKYYLSALLQVVFGRSLYGRS